MGASICCFFVVFFFSNSFLSHIPSAAASLGLVIGTACGVKQSNTGISAVKAVAGNADPQTAGSNRCEDSGLFISAVLMNPNKTLQPFLNVVRLMF